MEGEIQFSRLFKFVVYKITFPNGKIYVGKDHGAGGHMVRYFGSWDWRLVEQDFSKAELTDFTIRREILFESEDKTEINRFEMQAIVKLGANNPEIGYNRMPKFRTSEGVDSRMSVDASLKVVTP